MGNRAKTKFFIRQKMSIAVTAAVLFVFVLILACAGTIRVHADGTIGILNNTPYDSFEELTEDLENNCKNGTAYIEMTTDWNAAKSEEFDRRLVIPEGCNATLSMHGHVFNRNRAYDFHWYQDLSDGELIYVDDKASLAIYGVTSDDEKQTEHKNVAVFTSTAKKDNANGRKTFYGAVLTGGVSSNGSGGIHIKEGCHVTLNDVTIAGCNADTGASTVVGIKTGYGGGVFVKGKGSKLTLNDSTITGCHAFRDGGGIYAGNYDNIDITLNNSHVDDNFASDDGGGINMDGENISLVGKNESSVSRNECTDLGGGVYLWNDDASVRGLTIEGNKAVSGGGVYTTEEGITLSGLTIKNNSASFQGGGIYIENDGVEIANCTITGNSNYGVCMDSGCDVDMLVSGKTVIKDNQKGNLTLQDDSDIIDFDRNEEMDVHIGYIKNPTAPEGYAISHILSDYSSQLTADDKDYVVVYSYRQMDQDKTGRRLRYIKKSNQSDDYGRVTQKPDYETVKIEDAGPTTDGKVNAGGERSGNGDYALIRGYFHHPKNDGGRDTDSVFYYSDGFFYGDPYVYNDHLATSSWTLAMSGFYLRRWNDDYTYKHQGARQFLSDIGCPDQLIYVNDSLVSKPSIDSIGVAIGSKKLQKYNGGSLEDTGDVLIAVTVRGAGYEAEWGSNVTLGSGNEDRGADKKGEALGFSQAADQAMDAIDYYINRYGLQDEIKAGKVKFWVSGFSRAGATANITSKRLVEKYADGSGAEGKNNKVFSYPLEAPKGGTDVAEQLTDKTKYYCIHNIINSGDVVPLVAPGEMGFKRYGVDHYIPGTVINAKTAEAYKAVVKKTEKTPSGSASAAGINKVTTYADNEYLDTNKDMESKASAKYNQYVARRDDMVKHLATIDHTILYDDYFHPYGTAADWGPYGKVGYYDGTKVEVFLPDFMTFLMQEAADAEAGDERTDTKVRVNRGKYAVGSITVNNKSYPSLQKVARDYFGAKKDYLTPIAGKGNAMFDAMDWLFTTGVSIYDLYTKVLGEYYFLNGEKREKYIKYFWDLADGQGAFSGLSTEEYNTIRDDWFSIADTALHFVDGDYDLGGRDKFGNEMPGQPNGTKKWINYPTFEISKSRMVYSLTLFKNIDMIIGMNHSPEIGLAWTRTYDDYWSKDNGEPIDFTEYKVNWVDPDNPDNVDGYGIDAPSAYTRDAKESDENGSDTNTSDTNNGDDDQNQNGNTYTELIEYKNDQHKDKNNVSGDTRIYLENGKIFDDTASTVSDDTRGEAIFYDLYDITGGDHAGERIELAKKRIYRGGIDLAAGNTKKAYKIVTYALSYGVLSYDESTYYKDVATYYINVRSGGHNVTKNIEPEREGISPVTYKYDEAEKVTLVADDYGDAYFDHWKIKCKGPEDEEWTDVTKKLLPNSQPNRASTWFRMPDTGSTTSTTPAYTWPEHYELICTAHYLPKIQKVTVVDYPKLPVAGEDLDIGATFYLDDQENAHDYSVKWVYIENGKEVVHRGKADYGTAYSAVFDIYPGVDSQGRTINFASQEYLKAFYKPEIAGVTTSITKNADGSVTVKINFPKTESKEKYTVTFVDGWNESGLDVIDTQEVEQGSAATEPSDNKWDGHRRSDHTFMGWDKVFNNITEDTTVTALWGNPAPQVFKVTFIDQRGEVGTVLKYDYVLQGESAIPPEVPEWKNHTFTGWNTDFSSVNADMEVCTVWEEDTPLELKVRPYDWFFDGYMNDYEVSYWVYPGEEVFLTVPTVPDHEFIAWDWVTDDGSLIDVDHRGDRIVSVVIPKNQTDNMKIEVDYVAVISEVIVNIDEPVAGRTMQTEARAKDGNTPATMSIRIGDEIYEVRPSFNTSESIEECVDIEWTPEPPIKDGNAIARYLTNYTAMIRLRPFDDGDKNHIWIKSDLDDDYTEVSDDFIYADDLKVTVNGKDAQFIKLLNEAYYTFPKTFYTLEEIVPPSDITGVPYGADKDDIEALLPPYVEIVLDDGTVMNAEVEWGEASVKESSGEYGAVTWTAEGRVTLPEGVNNKEGDEAIDLNVSINVITDAADSVAAPEADPKPGIYLQDQKVTLSTPTEGATIWYTTDGSDPSDADNPNRKKYTEDEEIPINRDDATEEESDAESKSTGRQQIVLKAIAVKDRMISSGVRTYTYTFANEIEVPEGKTLDYNEDYQTGVKAGRFYRLEAISEGVVIDEEGNAIAKEPGKYKVRAVLEDKDTFYWITDPEDPSKNTNEDQIIEFTIKKEADPDDPDNPDDKPVPDKPDDPDNPIEPDTPTPGVKQYTLTFKLNGGNLGGEEGTIMRTYDEGTVITLPAPTRKGYSFDYWKGSRYEAGQVYEVSEDHTFEAQWKKEGAGGRGGAKTGDETSVLSWIAVLTASVLILILATLRRKQKL